MKEWFNAVLLAVGRVARRQEKLTSDDIWAELPSDIVPEPRAIGSVLQAAAREGVIEPINEWRKSSRSEVNHGRPLRVWRSLIEGKSWSPGKGHNHA
jgi:hypothetical protein